MLLLATVMASVLGKRGVADWRKLHSIEHLLLVLEVMLLPLLLLLLQELLLLHLVDIRQMRLEVSVLHRDVAVAVCSLQHRVRTAAVAPRGDAWEPTTATPCRRAASRSRMRLPAIAGRVPARGPLERAYTPTGRTAAPAALGPGPRRPAPLRPLVRLLRMVGGYGLLVVRHTALRGAVVVATVRRVARVGTHVGAALVLLVLLLLLLADGRGRRDVRALALALGARLEAGRPVGAAGVGQQLLQLQLVRRDLLVTRLGRRLLLLSVATDPR